MSENTCNGCLSKPECYELNVVKYNKSCPCQECLVKCKCVHGCEEWDQYMREWDPDTFNKWHEYEINSGQRINQHD